MTVGTDQFRGQKIANAPRAATLATGRYGYVLFTVYCKADRKTLH